MFPPGTHPGLLDVTSVYSVELYDTTTDQDILIADELISQQLAWPDLCDKQDEGKYVKLKVREGSALIYLFIHVHVCICCQC